MPFFPSGIWQDFAVLLPIVYCPSLSRCLVGRGNIPRYLFITWDVISPVTHRKTSWGSFSSSSGRMQSNSNKIQDKSTDTISFKGGGFKYCLNIFHTPILGRSTHFELYFFKMGWNQHQAVFFCKSSLWPFGCGRFATFPNHWSQEWRPKKAQLGNWGMRSKVWAFIQVKECPDTPTPSTTSSPTAILEMGKLFSLGSVPSFIMILLVYERNFLSRCWAKTPVIDNSIDIFAMEEQHFVLDCDMCAISARYNGITYKGMLWRMPRLHVRSLSMRTYP